MKRATQVSCPFNMILSDDYVARAAGTRSPFPPGQVFGGGFRVQCTENGLIFHRNLLLFSMLKSFEFIETEQVEKRLISKNSQSLTISRESMHYSSSDKTSMPAGERVNVQDIRTAQMRRHLSREYLLREGSA